MARMPTLLELMQMDRNRSQAGAMGDFFNAVQMPMAAQPAAQPARAPAAAPMPAQAPAPAPERRGLLGGFFGPEGRDARARLAIALEGMTMRPNEALIGELQRGIEGRETAAQKNATVEWLKSRGREDLAAAIEGGLPAADALRIAMEPAPQADPLAAINLEKARIELERLRSGGIDPEKAYANEVELMKTYRTEPAVQAYNLLSGHYNTMLSAYETTQTDPMSQGAGDVAMVYSYMKMLDPGSTVMQGEQATAQNTSGVPDQVRNIYNTLITGAGLTPTQRQAFLTQAGGMLQVRERALAEVNELYAGTAQRGGVQPTFLIAPQPLPSFVPAVVPQSAVALGVTQEDWNLMNQDERKAFMGGN